MLRPIHRLIPFFLVAVAATAEARVSWRAITDHEGGFTISFPGRPKYQQIPNRQHGFTSESYSFFYQNHDLRITFVPFDPPPRTPAEASAALNNSSAAYTSGFGKLLGQEKLSDGGRQYDNLYSSEGRPGYMRTRLYVRHGNLYTLSCTNDGADSIDERLAERFFSSFRFLEDLPRQRVSPRKRVPRGKARSTGESNWFVQRGPDGDFSASFPGKPEYRLVRDQKSGIPLHQYLSFFGENHFIISYRDKTASELSPEQVSEQSVRGMVASHPGLQVLRQSRLPGGGYQTELEGIMAGEFARVRMRLFIRNSRVYIVSSTTWNLTGPNAGDVGRFFSSFSLF